MQNFMEPGGPAQPGQSAQEQPLKRSLTGFPTMMCCSSQRIQDSCDQTWPNSDLFLKDRDAFKELSPTINADSDVRT